MKPPSPGVGSCSPLPPFRVQERMTQVRVQSWSPLESVVFQSTPLAPGPVLNAMTRESLRQFRCVATWLIIAADNDEPCCNAAKQLAQRLAELGHGVRIAVPEGPEGCDWNDALKAAKGDQTKIADLRHSLLNAKRVKRQTRTHALGMVDFMNLQFPPREICSITGSRQQVSP